MEQVYVNQTELSGFVHQHELMNSHSVVFFMANVSIETVQNEIFNKPMKVLITFDDYNSYGKVTLMDSGLDPYLYPTVFEARWQKMEHKDHVFLHITDIHKKNAQIGKYDVKIVPLRVL